MVLSSPRSLGKRFHWQELRMRNMTPSSIFRWSTRLRPFPLGGSKVLLHLRGSQAFTISLLATSRQLSNGISAPAFSAGRWPSNAWCGRK